MDWERRLASRFVLRARGRMDLDTHGEVDRGRVYDDSERGLRRSLLSVEELSLTMTGRRFDLAGGRMAIPWGRADGFNPTDNLTPFDTLDPLDPERLAAWALRGRWYAGRMTIEGDFLPWPEPTRLPIAGGRWLPLPKEVANPAFPFGPATLPADFAEGTSTFPDRRLGEGAWAIKADYKGMAWEGSVSRYDGWDDQPVIVPSVGAPVGSPPAIPIALGREMVRLRATGADLAWVLGRFVLRVEAARHEREDAARSEFTFSVLEGEWSLGEWRIIAAWADIFGDEAQGTASPLFDQAALPALILHVERSVLTGIRASAQWIANLDGEGNLARLDLSWPLPHDLRVGAGIDLISGPSGGFLGAFDRNDRVRTSLRWSF